MSLDSTLVSHNVGTEACSFCLVFVFPLFGIFEPK